MSDFYFICRRCDCEVEETPQEHAVKYTCPKCIVSVYRLDYGKLLMLRQTNGGRVFGQVAHSEIEIVSPDVMDEDFPFRLMQIA